MNRLTKKNITDLETRHIRNSIYFPLFICFSIFLIQLIPFEQCHGIKPRQISNLEGLFTASFLHADWQHFLSNIGPLFLLLAGLFYYFPERIITIPVIGSLSINITVWVAAREGCHIGASGIIYFLAAYLTGMAFYSKRKNLAAFVLIIVFLYGSMIWGVFPGKEGVSWESHLFGAIWGIIFALVCKNDKTWNEIHQPETEEEEDNEDEFQTESENRLETKPPLINNSKSTNSAPKWMNIKEIEYNIANKPNNNNTKQY